MLSSRSTVPLVGRPRLWKSSLRRCITSVAIVTGITKRSHRWIDEHRGEISDEPSEIDPSDIGGWHPQPSASILCLPAELWELVTAQLGRDDLISLAYACRQLYWLLQPQLFKKLCLPRRCRLSDVSRFLVSMGRRNGTLSRVQYFNLDWDSSIAPEHPEGKVILALVRDVFKFLPSMNNLRTLVIPEWILRSWQNLEQLPSSLEQLALTLPEGTYQWFGEAVLLEQAHHSTSVVRVARKATIETRRLSKHMLDGKHSQSHSSLWTQDALEHLRRGTSVRRLAFGCSVGSATLSHHLRDFEAQGIIFESMQLRGLQCFEEILTWPGVNPSLHTLVVQMADEDSNDMLMQMLVRVPISPESGRVDIFPALKTLAFRSGAKPEPLRDEDAIQYITNILGKFPRLEFATFKPWDISWIRPDGRPNSFSIISDTTKFPFEWPQKTWYGNPNE